jgi:hypothetical protein
MGTIIKYLLEAFSISVLSGDDVRVVNMEGNGFNEENIVKAQYFRMQSIFILSFMK